MAGLLTSLLPKVTGLSKWIGVALLVIGAGAIYVQTKRLERAQADALEQARRLGEETANVNILVETAKEAARDAERDRAARDKATVELGRLRRLRDEAAAKFSEAAKQESARDPSLAACLAMPLPPSLRWPSQVR